ncbi:MAG: hypothetical protein GX874_08760 [Smithella sp.]|nr:hypothetical protein [Smithella sp.]
MTEILFDANEDWEKRILCSDESCIGTVGPDGKCRECGKPFEGVLPEDHGQSALQTPDSAEENPAAPEEAASDDDWEKRVLCSDGACIGVIGPDGKCKECGKPLR